MIVHGNQLQQILLQTSDPIELRNQSGRAIRTLSPSEALDLDLDLFVGIGNRRRIRAIRALTTCFQLNAGSRTTRRVKDAAGRCIAPPLIREHRPRTI